MSDSVFVLHTGGTIGMVDTPEGSAPVADALGPYLDWLVETSRGGLPPIEFLVGSEEGESEVRQRLVAVANWPPNWRIGDLYDKGRARSARLHRRLDSVAEDLGGQP